MKIIPGLHYEAKFSSAGEIIAFWYWLQIHFKLPDVQKNIQSKEGFLMQNALLYSYKFFFNSGPCGFYESPTKEKKIKIQFKFSIKSFNDQDAGLWWSTIQTLRSKPPHNNINVQPTVIGKYKSYTVIISHIFRCLEEIDPNISSFNPLTPKIWLLTLPSSCWLV